MGRRGAVLGLVLSLLILLTVAVPGQGMAQEGNRAAIVVRFDDERTESRCVSFSEAAISGYELLQRSGLAIDVKSASQGGLVCAIEGTGCGLDSCLCQCKGEPCIYWSYWRAEDEGWAYSPIGATVRRLADGDVDGWSWGPGSVTSAIEPPAVSFDEVCADDAVVIEGAEGQGAVEQAAGAGEQGVEWLPYAGFVLLIVGLGGATLLARRRRGNQ